MVGRVAAEPPKSTTMKLHSLLFILPLLLVLTSCVDEELAFTVEASPVLGLIEPTTAADGMIAYTGTFYELDKSGILDNNIGIDSIPVSGLELSVTSQTRDVLQMLMTDGDGRATITVAADELIGATRLEWAGTHKGSAFRILKPL